MNTQLITQVERHRPTVHPVLTSNLYLDYTLQMKRGPDGAELNPTDAMSAGDDWIHFSITAALGVEAAWQSLGDDNVITCQVGINFFRPAKVSGGPIVALGRPIKVGATLSTCEAEVMQSQTLICKVHVTFCQLKEVR